MRKHEWFVVWVQSGREQQMCRLVERVCNDVAERECTEFIVSECFAPRIATQRKYKGEWQHVERLLLPGYIIAVTAEPAELAELLRTVPEFTRLLSMGETIVPLRKEEQVWLEEVTRKGDRVVPMSMAVRDCYDRLLLASL